MSSVDFYYAPGACSLVSHIALEETGVEFVPHALALVVGEHRTLEYVALNPSGKVPTLVVDGYPLTETLAIVHWLDDICPPAGLLPKSREPMKRAHDLSMIYWFASTVHPVFTRFRAAPAIIDDPAAYGKIAAHAAPVLAGYFQIAATRLGRQEWVLGDRSVADAYLFWLWTEAVAGGFDGASFPALAAHTERFAERSTTRAALAREATAVAAFVRRGVSMKFPEVR
ncbi:glutathione S-transferase family protein [Paraburkholderia caffeinilytica]|uniref:glutathione S-transferase family protein n=1 Tax=Paraburkholderia caffeinilytica TaxID=1761016 RepID=UPI003D9FBAC4